MGYLSNVNWWAVIACTVVSMVIGFLWYSPILFAKPWCEAMGFDVNDKAKMEEMKKSAGPKYGLATLMYFISAFMLAKVSGYMDLHTPLVGVKLGLGIWFGFVTTVQLTNTLFSGKTMKLWLIDTGYQLVCYVAMGVIICAWR